MKAPRRFGFSEKMQELKPGKEVKIAGLLVEFIPLRFGQIAKVIRHANKMAVEWSEAGITFDNFSDKINIAKMVGIAVDKCPEFLQEISNIHSDDLQELDFEELLKVVEAVIEVNEESFSNLSKNWQSLTEKLEKLPFIKTKKIPEAPVQDDQK